MAPEGFVSLQVPTVPAGICSCFSRQVFSFENGQFLKIYNKPEIKNQCGYPNKDPDSIFRFN